jgi:hypothetical protein
MRGDMAIRASECAKRINALVTVDFGPTLKAEKAQLAGAEVKASDQAYRSVEDHAA